MNNDFEFSDVQLEFQSQPDEDSDEDKTESQFTQKTNYNTESQSQTFSQSQNEALFPRSQEDAKTNGEGSEMTESELNYEDDTETDLNCHETFDRYDLASLPEHACSYCGIYSPDSVVKCNDCKKWFCNNRGSTTGAHIINHLVRSGHKKVSLHKDSPLGQTVLECFNCGGKNVFLLGFIPAKSESIVVLLCREPCLTLNSLKEMNWDLSQWVPLIKDRIFLSWLVKMPTEKEINRSIKITAAQIAKLEELWNTGNESATIDDLDRQELNDEVDPVLVRYENAHLFCKIYAPLIRLESEHDKKAKEAQLQTGVNVRWDMGLDNRPIFYFRLNRNIEVNIRIVAGDELMLSYPGDVVNKPWEALAIVQKTTINDEIMAKLKNRSDNAPVHQAFGFNVDFIWKPVPFERMNRAIHIFANDDYSVTGYLYHLLMGRNVEPQHIFVEDRADFSAPGLPKLNTSQNEAVKNSLAQPLSLIQGPPGTGKTVTSASLVYHLAQRGRGQILVCAPSNIGVDQLTVKLHSTGLKVVRLASRTRELVYSFVDFLYLNSLVNQLAKESNSDLYKLEILRDLQGELSKKDEDRHRNLLNSFERELLQNADIICTTCVGAGDPRIKNFRFKTVVIDESTQATEPEAFIPIVKGAKQICLIGDHCQLGPVIISKKAAQAGMQRSLFERMIMLGIRPVRLQVQYRMHPCLSEFPSNTFYEGSLQNGVSVEDRKQKEGVSFDWPDPDSPMFFYCSVGQEEFSASGTSYLNRIEAVNVEKIVTKLLKSGIIPEQIGVITPYEGQRQYIISNMLRTGSLKKSWYEELEVSNVDAFQGREKDYIILSCVRSNENLGIGFLSDPRRLNVALTRAKFGLIVVGNPRMLTTQPLWHNLLTHFKKNHLLIEGPLDNLTESFIRFSDPKDYYERRRLYAANMEEEKEYEDLDYYRRSSSFGGRTEEFGEELPTQYIYAHPGKIGPSNASNSFFNLSQSDQMLGRTARPPVVNRRPRTQSGTAVPQTDLSSMPEYASQSQPFTYSHSQSLASQTSQDVGTSFADFHENQSQQTVLQNSNYNFNTEFNKLHKERFVHQKASNGGFEGFTGLSQSGAFTQSGVENDEFTQHLQSQMSTFQTQPESQIEQDLNDLSLGGYSQELNDFSQTDLEEIEEDSEN